MGIKITLFEMFGRLSILILAGGVYELIIRNFANINYNLISVIALIISFILGLIWVQLPLIKFYIEDDANHKNSNTRKEVTQ